MARGFESKQVESQQEEAARPKFRSAALSQEEAERIDRRRTLELSRARLTADLQRATVPAHRQMLEQALAALDGQILDLGPRKGADQ
jgi:hypothetical protein